MTTYKMIACDLDGTLLDSELKISAENAAAIRETVARGVTFVPTTGRAFGEIDPSVLRLDGVRYVISSNGTLVLDLQTGERIKTCIARDDAQAIFDILDGYERFELLHYEGDSYVDAALCNERDYERFYLNRHFRTVIEDSNRKVEGYNEWRRKLDNIEMVSVFIPDGERLAECAERVRALGAYSVVSSAAHSIEFFRSDAGKGNILLKFAERLSIPREAVIAVGDSINDSSMIKAAGLGLAVGNAFPELKAVADAVICSNDAHCIEYILRHYIQ